MKQKPGKLVPAAARASGVGVTAYTTEETLLSDEAVATFERLIGGREALVDVLAVADDAPEVARVVDLLLDARYDTYSLRRLCTITGLTVADFFAAYRKATIVRAHIQMAPIIAAKIVGVVDDLMTRAQPHYLTCASCRGTGSQPFQRPISRRIHGRHCVSVRRGGGKPGVGVPSGGMSGHEYAIAAYVIAAYRDVIGGRVPAEIDCGVAAGHSAESAGRAWPDHIRCRITGAAAGTGIGNAIA